MSEVNTHFERMKTKPPVFWYKIECYHGVNLFVLSIFFKNYFFYLK